MPPVSRTEPRRLNSGTPRDTVYPWGKGINKQKTNKQIKCVCLVKSAVCDVAFGDRRELLHEGAKPRPHVVCFSFDQPIVASNSRLSFARILLFPTGTQYPAGAPITALVTRQSSQAITLTLLLVCAFSPKVHKYLLGSPDLCLARAYFNVRYINFIQ